MHSCVKCAFPFHCSLFVTASRKKTPETPVCSCFQRSILSISSFHRRCDPSRRRSLKSIATLTSDLLELPFLGELLIQSLQLLNQVSTSSDDGVLGSEGSIGLDTQFKGCEQRVRDFVGGEQDVG
jgi:hypothetical protein